MTRVRITIDGSHALTVRQALDRYRDDYGIQSIYAMHAVIRRAGLTPDGHIDERTPLYLARKLDALMQSRPGRGNWR